jgi:hypothetical protein
MKKGNYVIYLAGAIEDVEDGGIGWRERYKEEIEKRGTFEVLIPNDFAEQDGFTLGEIKELQKKKDLSRFKQIMHQCIVKPDLAAVEGSDIVIVRYEGEKTAGTIDECCLAYRAGISVLMVSSLPQEDIPAWLLAHTTSLFSSEDELLDCFETLSGFNYITDL